ncbi:MAG: carboxypeptidase-like regulatory domain-containing protein, partial [Chitinophagaceae bacterium]|nr:carboxypeptidase-like regulatory domain-containing protein [Chitinophagaceae bacterium]
MTKLNNRLTYLAGIFIFCFCVLFNSLSANAQTLTQSVRGVVVDKVSKQALSDVTVMWQQGALNGGTKTDEQGRYELNKVPVGRIQLQFSLLGYGTVILNEVMLNTGKELILHIEMEERVVSGKTVVIRNKRDKDRPMNEMAVVSARMFSVDETN